MSRLSRLQKLEADQARRQPPRAAERGPLVEEALALLVSLPAEQRAHVEASGARGLAELLEGYWLTGGRPDDLPGAALNAYRAVLQVQA